MTPRATSESELKRLADFIVSEIPGEPSRSEGAVDTAIRLLQQGARDVKRFRSMLEREAARLVRCADDFFAKRDDDRDRTRRLRFENMANTYLECARNLRLLVLELPSPAAKTPAPSCAEPAPAPTRVLYRAKITDLPRAGTPLNSTQTWVLDRDLIGKLVVHRIEDPPGITAVLPAAWLERLDPPAPEEPGPGAYVLGEEIIVRWPGDLTPDRWMVRDHEASDGVVYRTWTSMWEIYGGPGIVVRRLVAQLAQGDDCGTE